MYDYQNPLSGDFSHGYSYEEVRQLAERLTQIEYRLQLLLNTLSQQQQYYQQMQHPNFLYQNEWFASPLYPRAEESEQPEPGIPSEAHKLPEKPRREYIPPGVSGIVRM